MKHKILRVHPSVQITQDYEYRAELRLQITLPHDANPQETLRTLMEILDRVIEEVKAA